VWSGILWTGLAAVANNTLTCGGEGWWSYPRRRLIRQTMTYAGQDQLFIARDLVNYMQGITGGNLGFVVGSETCGVLRDRTWNAYERKFIGAEIEQLAAVENGFDFAVDCSYVGTTVQKTLALSYPRRGVRTALVFALGSNLEDMSQQIDATVAANLIDATGAGSADTMLIATAADTSQLTRYPLLEDVVPFHDISDPSTLFGHAQSALLARAAPLETLPAVLTHTGPDSQVGSFQTGDAIFVTGTLGYISVNSYQRIMGYEVSVDENGREAVAITMVPDGVT
jgi:hypothetical protein